MVETESAKKYVGYLQTIAWISFLSAGIDILLIFLRKPTILIQQCLAWGSVVVLVVSGILGLSIASKLEIYGPINKFVGKLDKGKCVTVLFFVHLICTAIFIVQDGGARTSCITNILLLDAGFGYFFAEKRKIKRAVTILCFIAYSICLIFFYDSDKKDFGLFLTFEIIPYMVAVLFVFGVNAIINYQITNKQES